MSSQDVNDRYIFYPTGAGGISDRTQWHFFLIGCGGTGSFIAHAISQLKASQTREGRSIGRVVLVDPDIVEEKNVGRQNFAPADVGISKSQTLAWRYNLGFGIDMEWVNSEFSKDLLPQRTTSLDRVILIGAVDTGPARAEISEILKARTDDIVWIDSGNGQSRGQVVIGNTFDAERISSSINRDVKIAAYLPYPSLALPELLVEDQEIIPSCAEALVANEQSLYVNRFMAGIVGEYIRRLLATDLTVFQTWIDLSTMEMTSVPINKYHIDRLSGLSKEDDILSGVVLEEVLSQSR